MLPLEVFANPKPCAQGETFRNPANSGNWEAKEVSKTLGAEEREAGVQGHQDEVAPINTPAFQLRTQRVHVPGIREKLKPALKKSKINPQWAYGDLPVLYLLAGRKQNHFRRKISFRASTIFIYATYSIQVNLLGILKNRTK